MTRAFFQNARRGSYAMATVITDHVWELAELLAPENFSFAAQEAKLSLRPQLRKCSVNIMYGLSFQVISTRRAPLNGPSVTMISSSFGINSVRTTLLCRLPLAETAGHDLVSW